MEIRGRVARFRGLCRRMPIPIRMVVWCLVVYVGVTIVFSQFQRSLVYLPTRDSSIEPADAGLPVGRVHTITLATDDSLQVRGWHILAEGQTAQTREECDQQLVGRWLVLFFSGNAANRRYRVDEFGLLTELGANVFLFDYRGYGDNPGSPSEEQLAADAQAIWSYATHQRHVPPEQILLYGESLGGGVAVRLAAELCERQTAPAGLIVRSTFSSLVDVGCYHYPWLPVRMVLTERYPSNDVAPSVTCPVLQMHGAEDTIVPMQLGKKLFDALPPTSATGIAKRFVTLMDADHNDVLWVAEDEMRAALAQFLADLPEME